MGTIDPSDPALMEENCPQPRSERIGQREEATIPNTSERKSTSNELEAKCIEFMGATQLNRRKQIDDVFSHTCQECGHKTGVSGSAIRIARKNNEELHLHCGHTIVVDSPAS